METLNEGIMGARGLLSSGSSDGYGRVERNMCELLFSEVVGKLDF